MSISQTLVFLSLLVAPLSGFQVNAVGRASRPVAPLRRAVAPACQFGGGEPERPKITRDTEPEEFFKTNMGACAACGISYQDVSLE
jgi:hypothetical protein